MNLGPSLRPGLIAALVCLASPASSARAEISPARAACIGDRITEGLGNGDLLNPATDSRITFNILSAPAGAR